MEAPVFGGRVSISQGRGSGMLHDIWDTPKAMSDVLESFLKGGKVEIPSLNQVFPSNHKFAGKTALEVMADCHVNNQQKITIVGCGTSYHVALLAEYLIEHIARVPVEVAYASEYRYRSMLHCEGDVLIAISSSGETLDTLEGLSALKSSSVCNNVLTVACVNEAKSSLSREADACICTNAADEKGVASTKIFSATSLMFVLLAIALGQQNGELETNEIRAPGSLERLLESVRTVPELVQKVLDREALALKPDGQNGRGAKIRMGECKLWDIGCQNVLANNFLFLGRGFNFPIALEGAMKCKEVSYIHAEGYPAAEMKHGPIALIDQFMPVVCIAPRSDATFDNIKANIEEVKARNGSVIVITDDSGETSNELDDLCEYVIKVPATHEYVMPLVAVIPMQLLAYVMGRLRGHNVDDPRGLQKVVTA
jgi:glucosamine--fructose-6-phosphate aminotransferase (isomerizing)